MIISDRLPSPLFSFLSFSPFLSLSSAQYWAQGLSCAQRTLNHSPNSKTFNSLQLWLILAVFILCSSWNGCLTSVPCYLFSTCSTCLLFFHLPCNSPCPIVFCSPPSLSAIHAPQWKAKHTPTSRLYHCIVCTHCHLLSDTLVTSGPFVPAAVCCSKASHWPLAHCQLFTTLHFFLQE